MIFKTLPKHIQDAIFNLTKDDTFQERFRTDKILDEIDGMKENLDEEYLSFLAILQRKVSIKGREVYMLTPAMLTLLYILKSPFVSFKKEPTLNDVDLMMYILDSGINELDSVKLFMNSLDYCKKNEIDLTVAIDIIISVIKIAFRPLKLCPKSNSQGDTKPVYDCDWMTLLVAKVHSVTGYSPEYIMKEMSLTSACYYFAQHRRMNGDESIYKRTDEELLILQDDRCCEMICDRLIELEVFPPEEKAKWKKEMLTLPK